MSALVGLHVLCLLQTTLIVLISHLSVCVEDHFKACLSSATLISGKVTN